ncbi:MAG: hypothetical protein WCB68_13890 [Pyrinomonadaceae bacterium]
MKHLRQLGLGILLVLALSMPAFAGNMPISGIAGPQESPGVTGIIHTPGLAGDILTPPGLAAIISLLF